MNDTNKTVGFEFAVNGNVQCECGAALGETCSGTLGADAVTIEWLPDHLRASHEAARNSGSWPDNGALRLRVTPHCARHLEQHDRKWTHRMLLVDLEQDSSDEAREEEDFDRRVEETLDERARADMDDLNTEIAKDLGVA